MAITNSLTSPNVFDPQQDLDRKLTTVYPETPFGNMALALSGGGFRAAAFSLGAISYLNSAWMESPADTLLKHVTFSTSTSGGTLANAYYTSCLFKPGFCFTDFYRSMRNFLEGETLLEEVCALLNDPRRWDEVGQQTGNNGKSKKVEKSRNLINSFAKAYDALLFSDPADPGKSLFDVYFDHTENPHLKTVCFNSTELNNGISFRFQTNGDPASIRTVGNYYLHFNNADIARKLKLSDITAASSCFPGGFEPMIYPDDYVHPGLTDVDTMLKAIDYKDNDPLNQAKIAGKPFCMVDGGVVDNQGLYSMMMEDTYRAENSTKKPFDLMMVCDVDSYFMKGFVTPQKSDSWWKNLSIDKFKKLMPVGVILFAVSGLLVALGCGVWRRAGLLFLLPSAIYTILYLLVINMYNKGLAGLKTTFGKIIVKVFGFFFKLPFSGLVQMLAAREKSLLMVAVHLFMAQIRRQYYADFYGMPAYRHRVLSCYIYEFSAQHDATRIENLKIKDKEWWDNVSAILQPSAAMQVTATTATCMGTTLWFDKGEEAMRDDIIACGQFTMCYNLLKHIYRLEVLDKKWLDYTPLQGLKQRLLQDWEKFKDKPDFMVALG